jgi:tripartite-type tricarboxylate transporter receptor subunit TctC
MKKKLSAILTAIIMSFAALDYSMAVAKEQITVEFSAGASQPNVAPYLKMLEVANSMQNKYEFVLEFKPGANGVLAIKTMDQNPINRLATTAPAFVENSSAGLINEDDYVPVATQGDACWAVITNVGDTKKGIASLKGQKEITVGGTGYGNAAHLTALIIGKEYGFKVRYIVYKANYNALVDMTGGQPINFVIERVSNYQTFVKQNPKLQILGINCSKRNALMPNVKTLAEQGFNTPTIFLSTIANVKMPKERRQEISKILDQAQQKIGLNYIIETSDMYPPMFINDGPSTTEFFNQRVLQVKALTHKFRQQIDEAK